MVWKNTFLQKSQNVGVPCKSTGTLPKKTKLGANIMDCVSIGYALNSSAYKFLVHKSEIFDIHVNMIIESRNDVFYEDIFRTNGKKKRLLAKEHMKQHSRMKDPMNQQLMRKLN